MFCLLCRSACPLWLYRRWLVAFYPSVVRPAWGVPCVLSRVHFVRSIARSIARSPGMFEPTCAGRCPSVGPDEGTTTQDTTVSWRTVQGSFRTARIECVPVYFVPPCGPPWDPTRTLVVFSIDGCILDRYSRSPHFQYSMLFNFFLKCFHSIRSIVPIVAC